MRDLSGTTAATESVKQNYRPVWLVEIDVDVVAGGTATLRYASRMYTLGATVYTDGLVPSGLALGWAELRERGGLASVGDFSVELAAPGGLAATLALYRMDNAEVRVYVIFCTGSETAADKILLQTGVVEETQWSPQTIAFRCIDASDRDWREVPTHKVSLGEHPNAPLENYGQVVPVTFGVFAGGPDDPEPEYGATRCVDAFLPAYTAGYYRHDEATNALVEHVDAAASAAAVDDIAWYDSQFVQTAGPGYPDALFGPASVDRTLRLTPMLPLAANNVASWRWAADNDTATYATVASGETLGLQWCNVPAAGTIAGVTLKIETNGGSTGAFLATVFFGADTLVTYAASANVSQALTTALGDAHVEAWHFEQMTVTVAPTTASDVEVTRVYLEVAYAGQEAATRSTTPRMFLSAFEGVVNSSLHQSWLITDTDGDPTDGPVAQLVYALGGKDLFALPAASLDGASFNAAYLLRDGAGSPWRTHFQLMQAVGWDFWEALCFEAGLHLFQNAAAEWQCVARDKTAAAVHAFTTADIALQDAARLDSSPDFRARLDSSPDFRAWLTPSRDVVNEIVLRYDYDPVTERCRKVSTRTGVYRYTGTCAIDAGAKTLTDGSATFESGNYKAYVGDRIYVAGKYTLVVTAVTNDTVLAIDLWDRETESLSNAAATAYYGGAGVTGTMVESYLRYKTIGRLGSIYDPTQDQGGYASAFLYGDAGETAELFLDYAEDWFSWRRMTVEFSTFLGAVDVELGDVATLDCPTIPAAYASVKWEVTGVQYVPAAAQIRLRLTEIPA